MSRREHSGTSVRATAAAAERLASCQTSPMASSRKPPAQLRLLVLGGTNFLGRAFVARALEAGHELTLFNRNKTNRELFSGRVEKVVGDRTIDLRALEARGFDAVVDVACYFPVDAARAVEALCLAARYLFVSSVSVYADQSVPCDEHSPVAELRDPTDKSDKSYGARKAACEEIVRAAFGEKATVVRPGLIVGPHDPTDRFGYWPRRMALGGEVLAPGDPSDPQQFIDVRDLASFMLALLEGDRGGTFNAAGETIAFASLLAACEEELQGGATVTWVPSQELLALGIDPWGVPLWISDPEWLAAHRVVIDRAVSLGLSFRPLRETIRSAYELAAPRRLSDFDLATEVRILDEMRRGRRRKD